MLERALRSLESQTPPLASIIVVDSAPSSDETRRMIHDRFRGVRYLLEPRPGLDVARNLALVSAETRFVAFVDDDARVEPGWASALHRALTETPATAAVTGRVDALDLDTAASRLFEANGGFARGPDPIRLPRDRHRRLHGLPAPLIAWAISIGSGCNLALRRDSALAIGGFDPLLDDGDALPGGGDLDILWRLLDAGHEIAYEPAARACHEHRRSLDELAAQLAGHQRSLTAFLSKSALRGVSDARLAPAIFLGWRLLKPIVRLIRRGIGRDPLPFPMLMRILVESWRGPWIYAASRRAARAVPEHAR